MGSSIDAHCFTCGYDTFLITGGGMHNHTKYAAWPVICLSCSAVTTGNFKSSPLLCERCKNSNVSPLTTPDQWKGDGKTIANWSDLTLTNGHYRCPKCNQFELRFGTNFGRHSIIMWD